MSSISNINKEYNSIIDPGSYTGQIVQKEGMPGLLRYLHQPQYYALAALPTEWIVVSNKSPLYGKFGHHALIILPGNRLCEWRRRGPTEWGYKQASQMHMRQTTGKKIEQMWKTHQALAPIFHQTGNLLKRTGYLGYVPGINDCHTYIGRILEAANEPTSPLKRI